MIVFAELNEVQYRSGIKNKVYINPEKVIYVRPYNTVQEHNAIGGEVELATTAIGISDSRCIGVEEDIDTVMRILRDAIRRGVK